MPRPKRLTPYVADEVQTAEALVAFYETRLEQALEQLGAAIEKREERLKKKLPIRAGGHGIGS